MKEWAVSSQSDCLLREAVKQLVRPVSIVFCQSRDGNFEVQFILYNLPDYLHLPLASIRYNEVWKWFFFLHQTSITPSHHLLH